MIANEATLHMTPNDTEINYYIGHCMTVNPVL